LLKNTGNVEHTRHRSFHNFIMNLIAALGAYCFFDKNNELKSKFVRNGIS
jgi:hypothetical protein